MSAAEPSPLTSSDRDVVIVGVLRHSWLHSDRFVVSVDATPVAGEAATGSLAHRPTA